MGLTFRERLASDPYFAIRIQEVERKKLCPYSDKLLEREDPNSMDFDSKIKMMNDEEFKDHVRAAQQLMLDEKKQQEGQQKKEREHRERLRRTVVT
jgi:hypothetical protein